MAEKTDGHRPLTGTATPLRTVRPPSVVWHGVGSLFVVTAYDLVGKPLARQSFGDLDDPRSRFVFENGWPDERYRIHCRRMLHHEVWLYRAGAELQQDVPTTPDQIRIACQCVR